MFVKLFEYRLKLIIKNAVVLVCLALSVGLAFWTAESIQREEQGNGKYRIAMVDRDGGALAQRLIAELEENPLIILTITDETDAVRKVSVGRYDGAFILAEDFSQKLQEGRLEDLIRMVSPLSVTGAAPFSETVSAAVVDIWLEQVVNTTLVEKLTDMPEASGLSVEETVRWVEENYPYEDIITLEKIEITDKAQKADEPSTEKPFAYAVFVFCLFAYFAVAFSSEWGLTVTNVPMKLRLKAHGTRVVTVCFAAQLASVAVCLLFYLPLSILLAVRLGDVNGLAWAKSVVLMAIYLAGVNSMTLMVTHLVSNLMQMIVAQTTLGVMQMLLTSALLFNAGISALLERIMGVFPGYYVIGILQGDDQWMTFLLMTTGWMLASFVLSSIIDRDANTGGIHFFQRY